MILAFETGNSTTNVVIFDDRRIERVEVFRNSEVGSLPKFSAAIGKFLESLGRSPKDFEILLISSVVRSMETLEEEYCRERGLKFFNIRKEGKNLNFKAPGDMGADLMANVAAGIDIYGEYLIVIDLGTATTFAVIAKEGEFLGGSIVTGFGSMGRALVTDCDLLPSFNLGVPKRAFSCDTVEAMQAGLYYGYIGLLEEIVSRIEKEVGHRMRILMTGGHSGLFSGKLSFSVEMDKNLTFYGLRLIYEMNRVI
ncbi:MAG: type III pantothenate kinase [Rickettsiales bacterium]|nr:type III pantothenate kinase [Rickettsiales bacterium]